MKGFRSESTVPSCFPNEVPSSDGEAYCMIRYYHFQNDTRTEERLKTSLRGCRRKNLEELLKDEDLIGGFDTLLDIPGEILKYLCRIKQILLDLVGNDKQALPKIDQVTIEIIERRAPGASIVDAKFLRKQMQKGMIFSSFMELEREQIWSRLQRVDGLIISLFTFFKDLQYLQLCVDGLKRLTNVSRRESVFETLRNRYRGENELEDQPGSNAVRADLGIRQLIAASMRDYPFLPRATIKENTVQKAVPKTDLNVLYQLAELAYQLGFDSEQIQNALNSSPQNLRASRQQQLPSHVTSGPGIALAERCGIPRARAYETDRDSIYINYLHDQTAYEGEGITSFFVRKSVYLAFFGRPNQASSTWCSPINPNRPQWTTERMSEDIDEILSSYNRPDSTCSQEISESEYEDREWDFNQPPQNVVGYERIERNSYERKSLQQDMMKHYVLDQEIMDQEMLERERVQIKFKIWESSTWKDLRQLAVHPGIPSEVEQVETIAKMYLRSNIRIFDTSMMMWAPRQCFQVVVDNGTYTILLVRQMDESLIVTNELKTAYSMHAGLNLKRAAADDVSQPQKRKRR